MSIEADSSKELAEKLKTESGKAGGGLVVSKSLGVRFRSEVPEEVLRREEAEKAVARQMRRMEGEREAAAMGDEPMVVLVPPVRPRTSPRLLHSLTRSRSLSECCLPGSILESGGGG